MLIYLYYIPRLKGINIYSNGLLEEADVREEKHIVPSVSISKNSIKSGAGTLDNPYVLG